MREDQPWIEMGTAAVRVGSGGNWGQISGPAADVAITAAASIITGVTCYIRALYGHYFLCTLYYLYGTNATKEEVIVAMALLFVGGHRRSLSARGLNF